METLGGLIDQLSICNCKLFAVQDLVNKAAKEGEGLDPETTQKLVTLNLQRNALMREIDETFAEGVATGEVVVDPRVKLV